MPAAPQQGGGSSDNSMEIIWTIAALFVFGGIVWTFFREYLIFAYLKVKLYEIYVVGFFTQKLNDVAVFITSSDPAKLSFDDAMKVGVTVGDVLRWPFVILIFILAVVVYVGNSTRVFKQIYQMRDLVQAEKYNWPQIMPVANLDLINTDIDKGPWAMALTPMQFCKRFRLLEERQGQRKEGLIRKEWNRLEVTLKRGEANKLFVIQLGPLWQGTARLPIHARALFAAFAARINGEGSVTEAFLRKINLSYPTKLDFSGTDELLKKYENTKPVQAIMHSHAYMLGVMASMLQAAREDGVQASAEFLWLKPVDRRLWYMLNTIGRQTPFVEVAGPFAHWTAELEIGKKLIVPMIEEATNALELALKDVVYKRDEA